jgi:hypothetical protein
MMMKMAALIPRKKMTKRKKWTEFTDRLSWHLFTMVLFIESPENPE